MRVRPRVESGIREAYDSLRIGWMIKDESFLVLTQDQETLGSRSIDAMIFGYKGDGEKGPLIVYSEVLSVCLAFGRLGKGEKVLLQTIGPMMYFMNSG